MVARTSTVTNDINVIFLVTKRGKISQKHAQMYLRPIIHCAMNMKIIVFFQIKLSHIPVRKKKKGRKKGSKTNLKTKKKNVLLTN